MDLKRRKRTLPTNGVRVTFSGTEIISELLLKEILYDNSIYMLYRISTANGDLCGVYETKDCFCYSIFQTSIEHDYLAAGVESLVLFCYASQVLGGKYSLSEINRFISVDKCAQLTASCYGQGGRLRNVYDGVQPKREGDYVAGEASIQGYIRKLPAGQKASQEARELAESLGVRPGIERDLCSTVHPPGVPTERTQGIKRHFQVPERCLLKAAVFMLTALWGQNN